MKRARGWPRWRRSEQDRTGLRGEHGSTLVEFALVAPVLLLLLIGIFDVARIVNAYVTVSHASREGAHYASLHPTSSESDVFQNAIAPRIAPLNASTPTPLDVEVNWYDVSAATFKPFPVPASSPGPKGVPVQVRVQYQYSTVTFFIGSLLGQFGVSQLLTASSTDETIR